MLFKKKFINNAECSTIGRIYDMGGTPLGGSSKGEFNTHECVVRYEHDGQFYKHACFIDKEVLDNTHTCVVYYNSCNPSKSCTRVELNNYVDFTRSSLRVIIGFLVLSMLIIVAIICMVLKMR